MFEKDDEYSALLCKITQTPTPEYNKIYFRPLTIQGLTHFLLDGIDKLIDVIRKAIDEASKRGINTVEFFNTLDINKDGTIDRNEIKSGMQQISNQKVVLTDEELALIFTRFDLDHSGKIELNEFINIIHEESLLQKLTNKQRENIKITENDLYNEGSLTVVISDASGVQLSTVGQLRPYIKVRLSPFNGKLYYGETRPSSNVKCLNTTYKIEWYKHEENEILLKYPGIYASMSLSLVFNLYDTASHSDIDIGSASMSVDEIKRYILSGDNFYITLQNRKRMDVGVLSGTLNLLPYDMCSGINIEETKDAPRLDSPGTLYISINEAKGYSYQSGKVKVVLDPGKICDETKEVKQSNIGTIMKWTKADKKILKLAYPGDKVDVKLDFIILRDKLFSDEQVGHKIIEKKIIERAIGGGQIPIRLENQKGETVAVLEVSIQYIPDDDEFIDNNEGKEIIRDEDIENALTFARFKDIIKDAIPSSKTSEVMSKFKKYDKKGTGEIKISQFCNVLKEYNINVTKELQATIIHEFDPDRNGLINYNLFLIVLPSETNDEIVERLKKSILIAMSQGKDIKKAFQILDVNHKGYIDKQSFRQAIRTLIDPTPSDNDIDILFNKFDIDRNGTISYEEFFAKVTVDKSVDDKSVVETIIVKLKSLIKEDNIDDIRVIFDKFDKNGGGTLSKPEFISALKEIGVSLNEFEGNSIIKYFDENGDGVIDYEEFLKKIIPNYKTIQDSSLNEEILKKFREWAKLRPKVINLFRETLQKMSTTYIIVRHADGTIEGKGEVTKREFRSTLEAIGPKLDNKEWECIMKCYTSKTSTKIDPELFISSIRPTSMNNDFGESKYGDSSIPYSDNKSLYSIEQKIKDGINRMGQTFRIEDELQTRSINGKIYTKEFRKFLDYIKIDVNYDEFDLLMNNLDPTKLGYFYIPYFMDVLHISPPSNQNQINQQPYNPNLPFNPISSYNNNIPMYQNPQYYQSYPPPQFNGLSYLKIIPSSEDRRREYNDAKNEYDRTHKFTCPLCFRIQSKEYSDHCEICGYLNPYIDWDQVQFCKICHHPNPPTLRKCQICLSEIDKVIQYPIKPIEIKSETKSNERIENNMNDNKNYYK